MEVKVCTPAVLRTAPARGQVCDKEQMGYEQKPAALGYSPFPLNSLSKINNCKAFSFGKKSIKKVIHGIWGLKLYWGLGVKGIHLKLIALHLT